MVKKGRLTTNKKRRNSRIGKTSRVPKTRASGTWTEAAFLSFIRSGLRRMSARWRPKNDALIRARRKSKSKINLRLKWQFQCAHCGKWKSRKNVEVNHIEPVGTFTCLEQAGEFIERLFCEAENLEVVCKRCHLIETAKQRTTKKAITANVKKQTGLH